MHLPLPVTFNHNTATHQVICHRFLTLADQQPTLLIGFTGNEGHSWVEVEGEAVLESDPTALGYRQVLIVPPGSRKLLKAAPLTSVSADLDDLDGE